MLDGSRPLAGSLAVDAGVTIDGVDISARGRHQCASRQTARHHRCGESQRTGSQYQIVGLTAVNTLGLLTPASSPTANQSSRPTGHRR